MIKETGKTRTAKNVATRIAVLAVMAALLESVKWALNIFPNVELVSLFCALYGYVFGLIGVVPVFVFVCIEMLWWGINTWVLEYFVHFPLITVVFCFFRTLKIDKTWVFVTFITLLTAFFGVFTSFVDVTFFMGFEDFWRRFSIYYMRGIWFYVVHVACNFIVFLLLFKPLSKLLEKLKLSVGF